MSLKRTYLGFGLAAVLALVATAFFLADQIQTTSAASGGPEMRLTAQGCDADCTFANDEKFTLTVEILTAPTDGYVAAQSFINFGTDITYDVTLVATADEVTWEDCEGLTAVRGQIDLVTQLTPTDYTVNHGCLTGLLPPQPISTFVGSFLEISLTCSAGSSTTEVELLPNGDPVAGTSGAAFSLGAEPITAKTSNLMVTCGGAPGPTVPAEPSATPSGPTDTPGPTNTPAPATDTPVPPTATPIPEFVCGDVNRDGVVSELDALWILWKDAGLIDSILPLKDNNDDGLTDLIGDINGDRLVNSIDALLIHQLVAGNDFCVPPA